LGDWSDSRHQVKALWPKNDVPSAELRLDHQVIIRALK
jgi:hypothetical protein